MTQSMHRSGALVDQFGRVATDLRVSLTDKCNLRCTYCMPAEGLPWLPNAKLLNDAEVNALIRIAVTQLGVDEVRFTGGEPLLRPGLIGIIAAAASLDPRPQISLTTNGIGLAGKAQAMADAGLDRVNISLDTLDADRFKKITLRPRLDDVLESLTAAVAVGFLPVKINAVLVRGVNDDEAPALLRFALAHKYELRFIEQMPLDAGHTWSRERMVTAAEILDSLAAEFTLTPDPAHRGAAPAETWLVEGYEDLTGRPAKVGVIASVTRPFCGDCDRTRLTADGQIRNCLFGADEADLRELLRSGAPEAEIAQRWQAAMWGKKPGHSIDDPSFLQPVRPMSAIGG